MNSVTRNILLVSAMGAAAIMGIGLFLYDYNPNGLNIAKASEYETESSTTEILSDVKKAQELLTSQSTSTSLTSGETPVVKTNIVLKEYEVSKADLAIYTANGDYKKGRADPFAEVVEESAPSSGTTPTGSNQQGTTTSGETTQVSDGTYYNSKNTK